MEKALRIIRGYILKIEKLLFFFTYAILLTSVTMQIISRLCNLSLRWTDELSRLSFVWMVFIGISYCTGEGSHIKITLFQDKFNKYVKVFVDILIGVAVFATTLYVIYWSIPYLEFSKVFKTPALEISMNYVYISIPIGFGLSAINQIIRILDKIINLPLRIGAVPVEGK